MAARTIRILLIEDHPGDRRLVAEMLIEVSGAHTRFELVDAESVDEGLARLDESPVDAVLLDLGLPDASGLEGLRRLVQARPAMPTLVLTGHQDESLSLEAVRAGAQDYVLKRYMNAAWLRSAILFAIERRAMEATIEQMQQQIVALERDRAVQQTAGAAAHEINSPLAAIMMQIELLQLELPLSHHGELERALQQLQRIADIVRNMKTARHFQTKQYCADTDILDLEKAQNPPDPTEEGAAGSS